MERMACLKTIGHYMYTKLQKPLRNYCFKMEAASPKLNKQPNKNCVIEFQSLGLVGFVHECILFISGSSTIKLTRPCLPPTLVRCLYPKHISNPSMAYHKSK